MPYAHGGAQQVIYEICEGTKRYGIDCEVLALTSQESDTKIVGRHRVHFQQRTAKFASTDLSMSAVARLRELAANADVVHYHFPWPMMDIAHFLVLHGKPSVVTYHSDIVRHRFLYSFYRPIMHRFLASADAIVATSPAYARTSPVLSRYRNKVRVIPIGIDDAPCAIPIRPCCSGGARDWVAASSCSSAWLAITSGSTCCSRRRAGPECRS